MRDNITGEEYNISAKCVINATGPFTDVVRSMENSTAKKICQPSSGVHIVLPDYYRCVTLGFVLGNLRQTDIGVTALFLYQTCMQGGYDGCERTPP